MLQMYELDNNMRWFNDKNEHIHSPVHIHRKESSHAMKKMNRISLYALVWNDNEKHTVSLVISMIVHPVRCILYTLQCIQGNIGSLLKCLSGHPWYKTEWLLVAKSKSMGITCLVSRRARSLTDKLQSNCLMALLTDSPPRSQYVNVFTIGNCTYLHVVRIVLKIYLLL